MTKLFYAITMLALLTVSCNKKKQIDISIRLAQWDSMVEKQPQQVRDSLKLFNPQKLSRASQAYWGLLKTIADDKSYIDFTSDSLINSVEQYYKRHEQECDRHLRALVYQGIVRLRLAKEDSLVFVPLKEAEKLSAKHKTIDPSVGYMMYYHLGNIHSNNGNYANANAYLNKTLHLAKQKKDSTHIFDSYMSLYWNELEQGKNSEAATLLDSLNLYAGTFPDNLYALYNAEATYYKIIGEIEKSIEKKKRQIDMIPMVKEKIELFRNYYSLSDAFLEKNQLDSAMYYIRKSISHIQDTTYYLNYLIYRNAAQIAQKQGNESLALGYEQKAFELYEETIDKRLNTQILELEKRYNLSEAENKMLKAQRNSRIWFIIAVFLLLYLGMHIIIRRIIVNLKKREIVEKTRRLSAERKQMETQNALIRQKAIQQEKMLSVLFRFLGEYATVQEWTREMTNKIRGKDNKLGDEYESMLKKGQERFNRLGNILFTENEFEELFDIHTGLEIFSQSDRLLLIMLSTEASNQQIASLLNTTPHRLKTRKSYLKAKIEENCTSQNNFEQLLALFNKKKPIQTG